ncbi:MAG TPA: SRPBCC family protein [Longimicrobiaceae bacterium]|nr:SRPBCC family protein [Longimicrobiaceae bacterium]
MSATAQEAQNSASTDRIEKVIVLRAPRSRVWRALSSAEEFAAWFGVKLDGVFAEGTTVHGDVTHSNGTHICTVEMRIERIEAARYFSYRWHPYPIDPSYDYSADPMTLVEFTLEDAEGGTRLTIVESGFDQIPLARRAEAFRMNTGGWDGQARNLAKYVE